MKDLNHLMRRFSWYPERQAKTCLLRFKEWYWIIILKLNWRWLREKIPKDGLVVAAARVVETFAL